MDLDVHLAAIGAGDADAFAAWLAAAEPSVRGALRSFARAVDTEAILQEALLRTWQVAARVRPDGSPNALLRMAIRIAKNAAIDEVRRARPVGVDPGVLERTVDDVAPGPPDPLLRAAIARCRERLPDTPARVLAARLEGRGPDRALAEELGMRLNTFLKNVGRARALLLTCLRRAGVEVAGG